MTTPTIRIADQSIVRISTGGAAATGSLTAIYGKAQSIAGGHIMYPANDGFGPAGRDRYWQRTFEIENLTFELLDASEQPESLGPAELFMNVYTSYYTSAGALVTPIRQYRGFFTDLSNPTWDRTTDNPRPLEMVVTRVIHGGNADRRGLTKATAALYADSRTGELSTRLDGTGPVVDHYSAILTAHGLTPTGVGGDDTAQVAGA